MIVKCDMDSDTYDDVKQSEETDELTLAPLGSILPWVPKLNPSSGSPLPLPDGWMFCNGSDITKGKLVFNQKNQSFQGGFYHGEWRGI